MGIILTYHTTRYPFIDVSYIVSVSSKLNHNSISWADTEILGTFSPLTSLGRLELAYNDIHTLPTHSFTGLQRAKHLLLQHNPIGSIYEGVFSSMPGLVEMYVFSLVGCGSLHLYVGVGGYNYMFCVI